MSNPHNSSYSELLELIKSGNDDAFFALSKNFDKSIKVLSSFDGVSDSEREDLYQEGLIGLYKASITYDEESNASFTTFANVCIKHEILSALRKINAKKNIPLRSSLPFEASRAGDLITLDGPELLFIEKEDYSLLLEKIDSLLSKRERCVLKLYIKKKSYQDIANVLHTSPKSVDNAIQRIRTKLKDLK